MATYRELVSLCLDEVKLNSDDAFFTEDHVIFLLSKYRALIIKQELEKNKEELSDEYYQLLCIDLEETDAIPGLPCEGKFLKSTEKIPSTLNNLMRIHTDDFFAGDITYVSKNRFRYVGNNKWLKNIIYATKGPDDYLYLKSSNPQYLYLKHIKIDAVLENPEDAADLLCDDEGNSGCDVLDIKFPLEDGLIPQCIQLVVKELIGAVYRPKDYRNNSNDDLAEIASFIRNNMKSNFQKQLDND